MNETNEKPKAFENLLSIYRIMLTYPKPFVKIDYLVVARFYIFTILFGFFPCLGLAIHFTKISGAGPQYRNEQINDINAALQIMIALGYYATLFLVANKMLSFFKALKRNRPVNIDDVIKKFERLSTWFYRTTLFMCFVYGLDNTFHNSNCALKDMVDEDWTLVCGTQVPELFPVRLSGFLKVSLKIVNWFMLMWSFPSAMSIPAFGLGSIEMIVARIRQLKEMLSQIRFQGETNVELAGNQLRNCVRYYIEIKSLTNDMNNSVSLVFLPHYTVMSTILALLEYQMIVQFSAATVIRFAGWVFMEIIICVKGQALLDESLDLAQCVYNMEWYEMPKELRSMYKIFHMSVQKPLHFQAKPFTSLDTKFLMNVLKSSYSLMMFFRTWSDEI